MLYNQGWVNVAIGHGIHVYRLAASEPMTSIAYCSPFVPAEWIAAHGLRPCWLRTQAADGSSEMSGRRGVCPFAGAVIDTLACGAPWSAVVLTTACDQMRYAASVLEHRGDAPVFLMNLPSTWQTAAARSLYIDELHRLGRFLERLGGNAPDDRELAEVMLRFDDARDLVRRVRNGLNAREFAAALIAVREGIEVDERPPFVDTAAGTETIPNPGTQYSVPSTQCPEGDTPHVVRSAGDSAIGTRHLVLSEPRTPIPDTTDSVLSTRYSVLGAQYPVPNTGNSADGSGGVPLALVGGPLLEEDYDVLDWLERAGGRIVLNATEWGERTLPRPFHRDRVRTGPFEELAEAYFAIPGMFRRPNDPCYEYLRREMAARRVRGVVFRRYVWCDLWHAELARLKARSPFPVLDLDVAQNESSAEGRTAGRIEAFLETLKEGSGVGVQRSEVRGRNVNANRP